MKKGFCLSFRYLVLVIVMVVCVKLTRLEMKRWVDLAVMSVEMALRLTPFVLVI